MDMKKLGLAVAAALLLSGAAQAAPILWISDDNGNLATVDVATNTSVLIGNSGVDLTDIAFDAGGNLFGVAFTGSNSTLYRVNTATAALTSIGLLGVNGMNALVFGSDGTLYGASNATNQLYRIDPNTAASVALGGVGQSAGDLAFVGSQLYLSANNPVAAGDILRTIDFGPPATGSTVGAFGVEDMFGLARAENGILYGVARNRIYTIDTATGAATLAVTYNYLGRGDAYGSSFFLEAVSGVVPEPSSWAMMIVGFGAAGAMIRRSRRKSAVPAIA
jgi:PEP-CTERM motif